jgi:hypothetical protein
MYAIPAETAAQGQPFQKENLPGPGKCWWRTHNPSVNNSLHILCRVRARPEALVWMVVQIGRPACQHGTKPGVDEGFVHPVLCGHLIR